MYPEYEQFFHNEKPIIGMVTQPSLWNKFYPSEQYSYIVESNVKFLEASGARVVPLKYDSSIANLTKTFQYLNGLFIPNGNLLLFQKENKTDDVSELLNEKNLQNNNKTQSANNRTQYMQTVELLLNLSKKANDEGEYFPVWSQGQGFEALIESHCESKERSVVNVINKSKNVKFFKIASLSRLYSRMPDFIKNYIQNNQALYFNNKHGYRFS